MDTAHLEVIPLGGLGEFGMNMMAVRCQGEIVIIDTGLMFPRDDLLGVDLVIPDLTFLLQHKDEIRAVLLTHGHEDHIGALPYVLKEFSVPVYGSALTLGLVQSRLAEHDLLSSAQLHAVKARDTLEIDSMSIEFIGVTHSIADALALAIKTPAGTIVHTGDFKFDQSPPDQKMTDYDRLAFWGEQGVLALFSDSTNSERPGYTPSESLVRRHLEQLFHISKRKIILTCFASSVHRIQIVLDLAQEFGRKVIPIGRSMKENIAISRELGYLKPAEGILIDVQEASRLPEHQLVVLSTGSQGEPVSAMSRLALGTHKEISVGDGDVVILSARTIPGNETRVSHLINHLCRRGAKIFSDGYWNVHVSGHAFQEELKLMLNLLRPRFFVPIHGEFRQLYSHALIAQETGLPKERILMAETGDILAFTPNSAQITGKAPVGRRLIDQGGFTEVDEIVIRDRQHLSEEGMVLAVVAINKATGAMEGAPELVSRGHLQVEDSTAFLAEARQVLIESIEKSSKEERSDPVVLTEKLRADLKRFFRKRTATRPMIVPVIVEI